jgi:hypothetical protein
MRLLRTDADEVMDEEEEDVQALECATRRDALVRYCLGDPRVTACRRSCLI